MLIVLRLALGSGIASLSSEAWKEPFVISLCQEVSILAGATIRKALDNHFFAASGLSAIV
ncbi:hypothetical protein EAE96_001916 [Botrytis aclada]|nr:hypothetical protein EAE96_001916 [Botrytis aclada]